MNSEQMSPYGAARLNTTAINFTTKQKLLRHSSAAKIRCRDQCILGAPMATKGGPVLAPLGWKARALARDRCHSS